MGQQEVYDFLKANPDVFFTTKEIAHHLGIRQSSVTHSIKKMKDYGELVISAQRNPLNGGFNECYSLKTSLVGGSEDE